MNIVVLSSWKITGDLWAAMYSFAGPKLLTLQGPASLYTDVASKDLFDASPRCTLPCPASVVGDIGLTFGAHSSMRVAGGKQTAIKPHNQPSRRKCPGIPNSSRNGRALESSCVVEGSSFLGRDDKSLARLGSDNSEKAVCGRQFLFDEKWKNDRMCPKYDFREEGFLRTSGYVPPVQRNYHVHRSYEGYDLTSGPTVLLPSAISLNGRQPLSLDGYRHRPRMGNRTCSLFTIGACQKTQTYPDPVSGASASFVHRLSEISSLEGETVRQEKIRKLKKSKKQES